MGREVKRVPVDFDWPLRETWSGFLLPEELREADCPTCDGDGYTAEARAIANTFYPHQIGGPNAEALAWHDKIGQAEVDNLLAKGRLQTTVPREPTADDPRTWETVAKPRTAAEVNAANHHVSLMDSHDGVNRLILVAFRCEVLGIRTYCATCAGHTTIEKYPGQRAEAEAWQPTEPPTGDGWQVWETISEGSPISPVFPDRESLILWLMSPDYRFGGSTPLTRKQAEHFVTAGWAPTMIATAATGLINGDQYVEESND